MNEPRRTSRFNYYITPQITGELFLDGFLWGRGLFGKTITTTKASMKISQTPMPLVFKIIDSLEKYAEIDIVERDQSSGQPTEYIEISFLKPVDCPGFQKYRVVNPGWDDEFLRGFIYSRCVILGQGHTFVLTGTHWLDAIEEICTKRNISCNRHSSNILIPIKSCKHPFMIEWTECHDEEENDDFGIDVENIVFSSETNTHDSHEQIRLGFHQERKDILLSIRGIAGGRMFWFNNELYEFIESNDIELNLESRIALSYVSSKAEIDELRFDFNSGNYFNMIDDIEENRSENWIKKIETLTRSLRVILSENIKKNFFYGYPLKYALIGFDRWLNQNNNHPSSDLMTSELYFNLYSSYLKRNETREIDFIITRIAEMAQKTKYDLYKDLFSQILLSPIETDENI